MSVLGAPQQIRRTHIARPCRTQPSNLRHPCATGSSSFHNHMCVVKREAETDITDLNFEQRVEELARMLAAPT